ncbi:hypothetical protein FJY68_14315 [candidate division WOR-3 bacterium]|uniref:Uncharacterized protein n=1 Tax=candidate division WOR-3 bacterium TaxID=2052148 RepID=A0A937XKY0_UNCW3|nr:hypothetical protein [candidate division WOR-3 bacterium]
MRTCVILGLFAAVSARELPVSSELRLIWPYAGWAQVRSTLAVNQIGDSVGIQLTEPTQPAASQHSVKGAVPAADFRALWDSLDQLGFWRLGDTYKADGNGTPGRISLDAVYADKTDTSKTVTFFSPQWCKPEFQKVYYLIEGMTRLVQTPAEEQARVALKDVPVGKVMAILDMFPEMVPSYLSSHLGDTNLIARIYGFREMSATALKRAFPATRFYVGKDGKKPPHPYVMAISGRKRYGIDGFNQLLVDIGLEMNDACAVDVAKAFIIMAIGSSFPEVTFVRALTAAGEPDYTTRLDVLIDGQEEQWHFWSAYGLVMGVSRRNAKGHINMYTFIDAKIPSVR